jgi:hypothetical protein
VKVGDTVSVQALVDGSTITAQRVQDVTQLQANRPAWGHGPGTAAPAPAAATTSTSTSTSTTTTTDPGAA